MHLVRLAATTMAAAVLSCGIAHAQTDAIGAFHVPPGERAGDHWTPDAVNAATPAPKPNVNPDAVRAVSASTNRSALPAQAGAIAGGEPEANPTERKTGNVGDRPLIYAGKLFFSTPEGDFMCSSQFIGKRVLLTAAHCVRDDKTGDFYSNFEFHLQYDKGQSVHKYNAECEATFNTWVQEGEGKWTSDFAMILVTEDTETGWFGTQWNWEGNYDASTKIGYPVGVMKGEVIQVEHGPISIEDGIVELRHGNKAEQGGSSGGAWIGDYNSAKGDFNHVISIELFGYDDKPGVDYGPYFDDRIKTLYDYVNNGCK